MSSLSGRLERLEHLLRPSPRALAASTAEDPSARDQLRDKLAEMADRQGPLYPDERPDSEEVLARLNERLEVLTWGGGGR